MVTNYKTLFWSKEKNVYEAYWNDENTQSVSTNTLRKGYRDLEKHIEEHGFIDDLENCISTIKKMGRHFSGIGADIASGSMWLTAYLLKKMPGDITCLYSVDYSEHAICKLGPSLLNHYNVNNQNVTLCLGSFYSLDLPSNSLDFVVMSQAFHHATEPDKLLKEIYRVLREKGIVVMIGETYISKKTYLICYINYIFSLIISSDYFPAIFFKLLNKIKEFKKKKLTGSFQEIYFPPDPILGDHYHLKRQYERFFSRNLFRFINIKSKKRNHLAYVLYKR